MDCRRQHDARSVDASKKGPSNIDLSSFAVDITNNEWIDVNHLRKAIKEKQKKLMDFDRNQSMKKYFLYR